MQPLITNNADLAALGQRLQREPLVAVDTESNSLHAYRERLCLVQFSTPSEDALVDPFAFEDLAHLAPVFGDPSIEKIFHAAEYDLIVMQRQYQLTFTNLFDTMIAARILGRKKVGLGNLLEEDFGVKLEKKFQRADWGKRPLLPALLDYARMDTHYLIQLRNKLKTDLAEKGLWELAQEDFARLPQLIRAEEEQLAEVWRVKGARDLTPRQAAILQELAVYRQSRAAKADLPLFKIMGDSTLTAIAKEAPQSMDELKKLEGMSEGQVSRHGHSLLDAVRRGQDAAPLRRPPRPPYDEAYVERLDKLRDWRKAVAKELDVESDIVLPRDIMESIARANPRTLEQLEPLMASVPWRQRNYAAAVLGALQK